MMSSQNQNDLYEMNGSELKIHAQGDLLIMDGLSKCGSLVNSLKFQFKGLHYAREC